MYRIICFFVCILMMMSLNTLAAIPDYLWYLSHGGSNDQFASDIVADSAGNLIITGTFPVSTDLGGGFMISAGGFDIYLAKMDPEGNHVWSQRFGDAENQYVYGIAVDGDDNIILASDIYGNANFGGEDLVSLGERDICLAKFNSDGTHLWSQRFGDSDDEGVRGLGTDQEGNIILAGWFGGALDLGGGALISSGGDDMFLAKLDPTGGHLWSHCFGDTADQSIYDVSVAQDGSIAVVGKTTGVVDFGSGLLTGGGSFDIALARFDAHGSLLWANVYGDASFQICQRIDISPTGEYFLCGEAGGTIDFGGGPLGGPGQNTFLVKFGSSGAHIWSQLFPGPWGNDSDLELTADGNLYVVSTFTGTTDLGGGQLTSVGLYDALAACFTSAGQHLWSRRYGDEDRQTLVGVVDDEQGNTTFFGNFEGEMVLVEGDTLLAFDYDLLLAKVGPDLSNVPPPAPFHDIRVRAFPNPFNPRVNIEFDIPREARLTLSVHDVSGRLIHTLAERVYGSGIHEEVWNGCDSVGKPVGAGPYIFRLHGEGMQATKELMLVR